MFFRKVKIRNVRSIRDIELSFLNEKGEIRPWTLLLGENGTGKSTILRSIALLLAGSEALSELIGDVDSWIRNGEDQGGIQAELVTARGEERTISLELRRGQGIRRMFQENQESLDKLDRALSHSNRNYFNIGYGVSRRQNDSGPGKLGKVDLHKHPRAQSVATLFSGHAELVPFETWAMDLHYRRGAAGLKMVKETMRDLLPGITFKSIDREGRRLVFQTADGVVPLSQLSDGFQNVVSWCGDLLYRVTEVFSDYKKPLEARGLLLIDEIDLHLHPTWQRNLLKFLSDKLPNLQLIATTHSPFTAHQTGDGELFSIIRKTKRKGPELIAFKGAPNRLLLHQLVVTPFFGLATLNSRRMEEIRDEYRDLKKKKRKTAGDQKRFEELKDLLSDQPDWSEGRPYHREIKELLREIRDEKERRA